MKVQLVRAVSLLLIGLLFLFSGDSALNFLIVMVGALFAVPSIVAIADYIRYRHERSIFPFAALGSLLLGMWLAFSPSFFVGVFMYVLGGVLVAIGIYQFINLIVSSRTIPVSWVLYLFPVVVLLLGFFVLFNPFMAASIPFIMIGIGCVVSSINDMISLYRYRKTSQYKTDITIEDAEIVK